MTGRIEGRLLRADGSGFPSANVAIDGTGQSTRTDSTGRFAFDAAPAGMLSVTFTSGKNVQTVPGVQVTAGQTATVERIVSWEVGFYDQLTVEGASQRSQGLFDAPASVDGVHEATIALESPPAQVPKLLSAMPGVELAQSGVFDFNVNIRGLNAALTRRVLTLIDGRDPASVLIGAQEWAAFGFPVDELSKIEIVRGPGSALYGTNAFNGVVDITTKQPRDTPGGNVEVSFGELTTTRLSARHAGRIRGSTYYRAHGTFGRTDDFYQSRNVSVEYPGLPAEAIPLQRDRTQFESFGARIDHYLTGGRVVTAEGGWAHTDGNVILTGAGRIQGTGASRPFVRALFQTPRWQVAGYYDARDGDMASLTAGNTIVDDSLKASADLTRRIDYGTRAGTGNIILGANYRFQRADTRNDAGQSTILRDVEDAHEWSAYGQVEHPLFSQLKVVVAARVDDSTLFDTEFSPKAAVVYALAPTQTLRASYGHAFETGSFVHYFTRTAAAPPVTALSALEAALAPALGGVPLGFSQVPVLALGNENLEVEQVDSFEVGYSGVWGGQFLVGANYYWNHISDLITPLVPQVGTDLGRINPTYGPYQPPAALNAAQQNLVLNSLRASLPPELFEAMSNDLDSSPIFAVRSYTNFARVNLQGMELRLQYFVGDHVKADVGYSWLDFRPEAGPGDAYVSANAPPHSVTSGVQLAFEPWAGAVRYRWTDDFFWNGGAFRGTVPSAATLDVTVRYRFKSRTDIVFNVANTFDNEHYEIFGGDILHRRALLTLVQSW